MKHDGQEKFRVWGAKAILTSIIFPGIMMAVGWFASFVTTSTQTQAELDTVKRLNAQQFSHIEKTLGEIKEDQRIQNQDISDIKTFLMGRGSGK